LQNLAVRRVRASEARLLWRRLCQQFNFNRQALAAASASTTTNMEKPSARGPSPSRKAYLALKEGLNRQTKRPPPLPMKKKSGNAVRAIDRQTR